MKKLLIIFSMLLFTLETYANQGLSAAVGKCKIDGNATAQGIGAEIAISVIKILAGKAIDSAVQALSSDKKVTYEIVVPIENLKDLIDNKDNCLFVSSDKLKEANNTYQFVPASKFKSSFKFIKSDITEGIIRPVIVDWNYNKFLAEDCSWYRKCKERDIAISIGLLEPVSAKVKVASDSEPVNIVFENITEDKIKVDNKGTLPWIKVEKSLNGPVNIRVRIVETMEPYAISKALAEGINNQKDSIATALDARLRGVTDELEAKADQVKLTQAVTAFNEYTKSWQLAKTTADAYKIADDEKKKELELTFEYQIKSVELTELLAKAAYKNAGLNFSSGLGPISLH